RGPAMADVERVHGVAVELHEVPGLHLGDAELEPEAADDAVDEGEDLPRAGRPEEVQRRLAVAQVEGLEHARQPEPVVEVEVRELPDACRESTGTTGNRSRSDAPGATSTSRTRPWSFSSSGSTGGRWCGVRARR